MSLATSFALSEAVNESMMDESVRMSALALMETHNELDDEQFRDFLFQFAANLTAVTASYVTNVFMTQEEIDTMMKESVDLVKLGLDIESEDK